MEEITKTQIRDVLEHFKGAPITDEVLLEYTNRMGYSAISAGRYEDYAFSYGHDQRVAAVLPNIMFILGKVQNPPEIAEDTERKAIIDANEALESEICELLENSGILYQEVDLLLSGLASLLMRLLDSSKRRVDNMSASALLKIAEKELGKPITIKALADASRS